jgi:hypothetical protein
LTGARVTDRGVELIEFSLALEQVPHGASILTAGKPGAAPGFP